MIKEDYIEKSKAPRTPILISKTSNSMVFKLPCFRPKIPEEILLEDPKRGIISSMALYGKKANSTAVSVTSCDLNNTGIHYPMNSVVRVTSLSHNSKYCFAAAAYDLEENLSNQIGQTTQEIHTSQPVPINLLYAYLSKIAFQIEELGVAQRAAKQGCEYLLEKSLIKERLLNHEFHPVYIYRLNPDKMRKISGVEMRAASESLLIWSYCFLEDPERDKQSKKDLESETHNITRERERDALEVSNLLLLSIELAIPCQAFDIARKAILEIYNNLRDFFQMKTMSKLTFQILAKANMAMSLIPTFYWDDLLRKVSGKMAYQLVKLSLQINEFFFSKRVLYTEIKIPRRKYNLRAYVEMVEVAENTKGKKATTKPAAGAKKPDEEEEKKIVPLFKRDLVERNSYQPFLEEFLLTIHEDYYNFADYFQDYWNEHLNNLSDKISNEEVISLNRQELSRIIDFYSLFFDIGNMKKKIDETAAKTDRFVEYLSKFGRRLLEINFDNEATKDILNQLKEYKLNSKTDESNQLVDEYIGLKLEAFDANVDWNPAGLDILIEEEKTNNTGYVLPIQLFEKYFVLQQKVTDLMQAEWRSFRFNHLWNSEIAFLNAMSTFIMFKQTKPPRRVTQAISFCDIFELDINDRDKPEKKIGDPNSDAKSAALSARSKGSKDQLQTLMRGATEELKELTEQQLALLDTIFKFLSLAAVEALMSRCYRQLQNIIIYTQNIIVDEVIRPSELAKTDSWKSLTLIVDCCLLMVEDIKSFKDFNGFHDDDEANIFHAEPKSFKPKFFTVSRLNRKSMTPLDSLEEKKDFWFTKIPQLKISVIANVCGFTTQILMIKEKWNVLINLTKTLSNVTWHYYSKYTLPFTISAQEHLIKAAEEKKKARQEERTLARERFMAWAKTKKDKSRQNKISGTKLEEEKKFEAEDSLLEKQIEFCENTEKVYRSDRDQALNIKKDIDSVIKEPLKDLREQQRNLAKFAIKERQVTEAAKSRQMTEAEAASYNSLVSEAEKMIKSYKHLIDNSLRKRKEVYLATVALHDLGNLYYCVGDLKSAGIYWSEGVDEVFQRSNSIRGFNEILTGTSDTVKKYKLKALLVVLILLGKLATITYHKDIVSKRECVLMACRISYDILKISLEHPQNYKDLATYSLSNLGEEDCFIERKFLDPNDLLHYATQLAWTAIDFELNFRSLPLLCICEYLANHQCNSSFYSIRAKLLKSISLSSAGMINEAIINLLRVLYEKDLPMLASFKASEHVKLKMGQNFSFMQDWHYQNDVTPNDSRNVNVLNKVFAIALTDEQFFRIGPPNAHLFTYAKNALVFNMVRLENLDIDTYIDMRRNKLEAMQQTVIEDIKRLYFEEKLFTIVVPSEAKEALSSTEPEAEKWKKRRQVVSSFLSKSPFASQSTQYLAPLDSSLSSEEHRRDRISLLILNYILLSKACLSLNAFSNYYKYMRDCIGSLGKLAGDCFLLEFIDIPETQYNVDLKADKKKPQTDKDKPKDSKKAPPKKTAKDGKAEEEELTEEDLAQQLVALNQSAEASSLSATTLKGVNAYLWLMVKYEIANSLYLMKRWPVFLEFVDRLVLDCKSLNDEWYKRRCLELKARVLVMLGKKREAKELFLSIIDIGQRSKEDDMNHANFIADFGEFFFFEKDYPEALSRFRLAKSILSKRLKNYLSEFDFNNINALFTNEKICSELFENKYDIEQKLGRERIEKGGKGGKGAAADKGKKKDDKKPGVKDPSTLNHNIGTLFPLTQISNLKDQKVTMLQPDEQQDVPVNSSNEYVCVYATELEFYARLNQRIVHTLLIINKIEPNDPHISARKTDYEKVLTEAKLLLDENMFILRKNYFINSSIKAVNESLYSRQAKMHALFLFSKLQSDIIQSFQAGERPDYVKRIIRWLPNKNFALNKYILEAPMVTKFLREDFLPLLDKAKDHAIKALAYLKGESLLHEFDFSVADIFREVAETNLLMAEYRPRLNYRYVTNDDIRQYGLIKNHKTLLQDQHIFDKIQSEQKKDQELQTYLIWEAVEYLKNSISATKIVEKIREDYNRLGDDPEDFIDINKMNRDISEEIREARALIESVGLLSPRRSLSRTRTPARRSPKSTSSPTSSSCDKSARSSLSRTASPRNKSSR